MPSDIPNSNLVPPVPPRKPRKSSVYNVEERTLLAQYKQQYRSLPTREERLSLVRNKILVDIFNYWSGKGVNLTPDESHLRMKVNY
jgi:hypothetical protein